MFRKICLIFLAFLLLLAFPTKSFAVTVSITNYPSSISADPFSISVSILGASSGTNYIRVDLYKDGTQNYFGDTYNGSDWYNGSEGKQYYPITIIENAAFREIVKLYSKAKIFWSAAGYGVDEKSTPEKMEHFGISVVEAMASGAVPIIYDGGGHGEIIETGKTGYTWRKEKELLTTTLELTENKKRLGELAMHSIEASQKYSYERFKKDFG